MTLLNPWGLLGLAAIPVVLYIHMLQRRSRRLPVSTLFLLDVASLERQTGKRLDKLRQSMLLWLNLLAVLLLTGLLTQPRRVQAKKILKAVVVVDASASMQPFIDEARQTLFHDLNTLSQEAAGLELTIMSSILEEKTIYNGGELRQAQQRLASYRPSQAGHDVGPALRRALGILNSQGVVIFLSDTKRQVPDGVVQVLSGRQIDNVGFTGFVANNQGQWRASVRNYSKNKISLPYFLGTAEKEALVQESLHLEAGAMKTLEGEFFDNEDSLVLRLADDEFGPDNVICAMRPLKKQISVSLSELPLGSNAFYHKFFGRMTRVKVDSAAGDFFMGTVNGPVPADKPGIFWPAADSVEGKAIRGGVIAMADELVEGLNWEGVQMSIMTNPHFHKVSGALPLLQYEDETLVAVRQTGKGPQLLVQLDLNAAELQRSPAMMILIYRCLEKARLYKKSYSQVNLECNNILYEPSLKDTTLLVEGVRNMGSGRLAMPSSPGFFSVSEELLGEPQILLKGATFFADAGEADFSQALTLNGLEGTETAMTEVRREGDFLKPLWLILLLAICAYGWWRLDNRKKVSQQGFEVVL